MKAEEEANTGVQMAYVDETPSQMQNLPPYSVMISDKWSTKPTNWEQTIKKHKFLKQITLIYVSPQIRFFFLPSLFKAMRFSKEPNISLDEWDYEIWWDRVAVKIE